MNLYAITAQYRADLAALADLDIDPQTAADTLEGMQGELLDKLRAVIAYSLELGILAVGATEAAKRMQDRAKALDSRVEWLRAYALNSMQATGISEVTSDEFAAKVAKTRGRVVVTNLDTLPANFLRVRTTTEPDKDALRQAIEAGVLIDGVSIQTGLRLAIK